MSTDKTEQAPNVWRELYRRAINEANGLTNYVEDRPELRSAEKRIAKIEEEARAITAAPPAQQQSEPRSMPFLQCELIGDRPMVTVHQAQQYAKAYAAAATPPSLQEPQEAGRNV